MSKTAKRILIACVIALVCAVAGRAALDAVAISFWEQTLKGPYEGKGVSEMLPSSPTSSLTLKSIGTLELYQEPAQLTPILALRRDGKVRWARLMEPTQARENGQLETAQVRDARLIRRERSSDGIKIRFTCDWDWGGKEAGLIYLTKDGNFEKFGISW